MLEILLLIISVILLIITIIVLKKCHIIRYTYMGYSDQGELKHFKKLKKRKEYVIENQDNSNEYIKRYAIIKKKKGSLIVEYTHPFKNITFNVYLRTKKGKVLDCMEISEEFTSTNSKPITLPKYCYRVTFQVLKVNDEVLEDVEIKKTLKKSRIVTFALLRGLRFFSIFVIVRFLFIIIIFRENIVNYIDSDFSRITLIFTFIVPIIKFVVELIILLKQGKAKDGGEIEEI